MLSTIGSLLADMFLLPGQDHPRIRRWAYRHGKPVFIRAGFDGRFPWATELCLHGTRAWVVSNRGFDTERRVEITPDDNDIALERARRWSGGTRVSMGVDGQPLTITSLGDSRLLREAVASWRAIAHEGPF
ncbi:MAG: hypothetical protein JWR52_2715 [Marmoricola sp.]|nr:hypothetical protein [Marmoricola sp.]